MSFFRAVHGYALARYNRNYKKRADRGRKYFEQLAFDRLALVGFAILLMQSI